MKGWIKNCIEEIQLQMTVTDNDIKDYEENKQHKGFMTADGTVMHT
jgi:hypothetical protein